MATTPSASTTSVEVTIDDRENRYVSDTEVARADYQRLTQEGQNLERQRIQLEDQVEEGQRMIVNIDERLAEIDKEVDALPKEVKTDSVPPMGPVPMAPPASP